MTNERIQPRAPGDFTIQEVTDATFERDVLKNDKLTLIFFYSNGCGACKSMAETYNQIGIAFKDRIDFKKVCVDSNPAYAAKYASNLPQAGMPMSVILDKNGELIRNTRIDNGVSIWTGDAHSLHYFINWFNNVINISNENW